MPFDLRTKQLQANHWVGLMGQRHVHPVRVALQPNFFPVIMWPSVPLWQLQVPETDLLQFKANMNYEFQSQVRERCQDVILLLTDGSKDQKTGEVECQTS